MSRNPLSLIVLTVVGILAAADAGRMEEIRAADVVSLAACDITMSSPGRELRFEKIAAGDDVSMPSIVKFEWHPATGELSFATPATAFTLPESFVTAASAATIHRCE